MLLTQAITITSKAVVVAIAATATTKFSPLLLNTFRKSYVPLLISGLSVLQRQN